MDTDTNATEQAALNDPREAGVHGHSSPRDKLHLNVETGNLLRSSFPLV